MAAAKSSEIAISAMLRRMGIWHYKLADVPIPYWNKSTKAHEGARYTKEKPFDYVIVGAGGGGAIEVKSAGLSFSFLSLKGWTPTSNIFHLGFSGNEEYWPEELEKETHGIRPVQRRGLTRMYMEGGYPFIALQMGTGNVNGKNYPKRMWLVPWMRWVSKIEVPLLELGQTSLPYDLSCTKLLTVREDKLNAVDALRDFELVWDPTIKENTKWKIPPQSIIFTNTFGVEPGQLLSPQRVGLTQKISARTEPTVLRPTSDPSLPEMPLSVIS